MMIRTAISRVLCFVILTLLYGTTTSGQVTSMSNRYYMIGARAASLADSYVAEQSDIGAMYLNPASLSFIRHTSVIFNYALERVYGSDNVMTENVVMPVLFDTDWRLGLGFTSFHVGSTGALGSPLIGMNFHQYGVEFGLARRLTPALSVGILGNTVYARGSSIGLGTFASSVGVFYSPQPGISYGASFEGAGWGIEYKTVGGNTVPYRATLKRSLQMGLSLSVPARLDRQVVTVTLSNQKILGVSGIVYKGGIEVMPLYFFSLRAGYWVGQESVSGKLGGGIRTGRFTIDYAYSSGELEPKFHQISLSYLFVADTDQR